MTSRAVSPLTCCSGWAAPNFSATSSGVKWAPCNTCAKAYSAQPSSKKSPDRCKSVMRSPSVFHRNSTSPQPSIRADRTQSAANVVPIIKDAARYVCSKRRMSATSAPVSSNAAPEQSVSRRALRNAATPQPVGSTSLSSATRLRTLFTPRARNFPSSGRKAPAIKRRSAS